MNKENPMLTVVVPVYNVEKYLEDCLESLVNQTVIDHRIILVNDGSKDSSGEIAKAYAAKYPGMIQYVEQENQGLGAARNTGLALVETEYVAFLDSDDWWDCRLVEKLQYHLAHHEEGPDLIFTLPWIYDNVAKTVTAWHDKQLFENLFFPHADKNENVISETVSASQNRRIYELEVNACRRIYRTAFLKQENFAFPVGVKWEDVQPHFQLLKKAKSCIAIQSTGFIYRVNTGGQITAGGGASRLDVVTVYTDTLKMAYDNQWSPEEIGYIIRMLWNFATWSIGITNTEYIMPLLENLHSLFVSIPSKYFSVYYKTCSPQPKRDFVLTIVMRSPFYRILKDYRFRNIGVTVRQKIWQIEKKLGRK